MSAATVMGAAAVMRAAAAMPTTATVPVATPMPATMSKGLYRVEQDGKSTTNTAPIHVRIEMRYILVPCID